MVDEGIVHTVTNNTKFWKLPPKLKNAERYPLHAAEVVLIGVVPCDQNTEWPDLPCRVIQKGVLATYHQKTFHDNFSSDEIEENIDAAETLDLEERDTICRSKCPLIIGNTIWAKQVQLLEKLRSHDIDAEGKITYHYASNWTPVFEVKERLIRKGLANENSRHVSYLLDICKTANLPSEVMQNLLESSNLINPNTSVTATSNIVRSQNDTSVPHLDNSNGFGDANNGFNCPMEIKKLYQKSILDIFTSHQVAHLKIDPDIGEISDTGLPNEEDMKKHSLQTNISVAELQMKFRYLKWQKSLETSTDNTVILSYAYDPSCFYVRNAKFAKQLIYLENDIHEYAEQAKIVHSGNKIEFEEGRLCIGRLISGSSHDSGVFSVNTEIQDGKDTFEYKRVQILRQATEEDEAYERDPMVDFRYLDSGDENDNDEYSIEEDIRIATTKYTVFFVDYGYQKVLTSHDLLPIPKKYVEKLPLQAIGCSLANIVPAGENDAAWSNDAIEFIQEFASIKDSFSEGDRRFVTAKSVVLLKAMEVAKCEYDEETTEPNNWPIQYWVKLVSKEGGDHLGMQLLKKGLAEHDSYSEIMISHNESELKNFNSTKEIDNTNEDSVKHDLEVNKISNSGVKSVESTVNLKNNVPVATVIPVIKPTVKIPEELPGLCIIENCDNSLINNLKPQLVTWSQNKEQLAFRFQLELIYEQETCARNTFLSVESQSLTFEYLEIAHTIEKAEKYRHHSIPKICLYGAVDPQKSEVKLNGKEILVKLGKVNRCFWQYPTVDPETGKPRKVAWIKIDSNISWPDTSDDSDESDVGILPPGKEVLKKRPNKVASKIRYTLDQYPKPLNGNYEAKNFDESTDGLEDFFPSGRNEPNDMESDDTDNDDGMYYFVESFTSQKRFTSNVYKFFC